MSSWKKLLKSETENSVKNLTMSEEVKNASLKTREKTEFAEKPKEPKGNLAVPPFYCYRACDVKRIQEALDNGCGYDAPGSFAAWLSKQTPMHAYVMPGKRYDIGDINSYEYVKSVFTKRETERGESDHERF